MKAAIILVSFATLISLTAIAQATRSTLDGVYTAAQAERGDVLYGPRCAECHGDDLDGDPVEHPQLAGGKFRDTWNGLDLGTLFVRIHRDMPAGRAGTLSNDNTADLIAYILRENSYPAGATPLSADVNVLKQIRIDREKPAPK